jgi:2-C-methyl-D-erythritol 2,4-cyclodiphosphate synthase
MVAQLDRFAQDVTLPTSPLARVGIGHDTHRLRPGGPLRLGGVDIPHDKELVGHSDADVLLHAVTDALLGAAALGDIGEMFPDTDPSNRGRDSAEMLCAARAAVARAGWRVGNCDCIVFAEQPRLGPHKQAIRRRLAELLEVDLDRVGLKAKTGEQTGAIGRQEIIAAQCVALLERGERPQETIESHGG